MAVFFRSEDDFEEDDVNFSWSLKFIVKGDVVSVKYFLSPHSPENLRGHIVLPLFLDFNIIII